MAIRQTCVKLRFEHIVGVSAFSQLNVCLTQWEFRDVEAQHEYAEQKFADECVHRFVVHDERDRNADADKLMGTMNLSRHMWRCIRNLLQIGVSLGNEVGGGEQICE